MLETSASFGSDTMNLQQSSTICKGCWQHLHFPVVLRGPLAIPFRIVGLRPSRMNPNTCTFCELAFTRIMKARKVTIDATVLFADLRGYTAASQSLASSEITATLDAFYDECAEAIWEHDGLLNKTIGDAIMAVFNFPIRQTDHAEQAVRAARQIQDRWHSRHPDLVEGLGLVEGSLCIGIGISSGQVSFGEFGQSHRDLTAIGTVVNTAARAQSAADGGQILVTKAVRDRCAKDVVKGDGSVHDFKGFGAPIELYDAAGA
jgi:adenylate cyclase